MVTKVRYIDNGVVNADQITITTALPGDNSVSPATTAFVRQEISGLVDSSPGTLDTLNELAAALGDDPNFATTTATAIGLKAPIASPTFTGTATMDGLTVGIGDYLILDGGSAGEIVRVPIAGTVTIESRGSVDIYGDSNNNGTDTSAVFRVLRDSTYVGGTAKTTLNITDNGDISFYEDTGTTAKFFWDASAEALGIGTTDPQTSLHLSKATTGPIIRLQNSTNGVGENVLLGGIEWFNTDTSGEGPNVVSAIESYSGSSYGNDGYLTFSTYNSSESDSEGQRASEKVRITSDGKVGIGTDTPTQKLEVAGTTLVDNAKLKAIAVSNTDTAVDVFVYDTRKDSDGGAWRKRTQHTSWYNETLNTATRGARKEFPSVAVIVSGSNIVTIYDGDDPDMPMWMVFNGASGWLGGGTNFALSAKNGILAAGGNAVNQRLRLVFFLKDHCEDWATPNAGGGHRASVGNFLARNSQSSAGRTIDSTVGIIERTINDVAMTVLPNAPIDADTGLPVPTIAVATDGGVSVIKDEGAVVDITASAGSSYNGVGFISFDSNHNMIFEQDNIGRSLFYMPIPSADTTSNTSSAGSTDKKMLPFSSTNTTFPKFNGSNATLGIGGSGEDQYIHGGTGVTHYAQGPSDATSSVAYITSEYNTGWMVGDIKLATLSDTDTTSLNGDNLCAADDFSSGWSVTSGSNMSISNNQLAVTDTSNVGSSFCDQNISTTVGQEYVIDITATGTSGTGIGLYVTGYGGPVLGYQWEPTYSFTATATTTTVRLYRFEGHTGSGTITQVIIKEAAADRSVNNKGLQVFGTVSKTAVATAADLVGYGGFSTTNYLQQPYNSALDFGTGDFSIMGWFKSNTTVGGNQPLFWRGQTNANSYAMLEVYIRGDGKLDIVTRDASENTVYFSSNSNILTQTWRFWCMARRSGVVYIYVDGKFDGSLASTINITPSTASKGILEVGSDVSKGKSIPGYIALFRISATAPSEEQIAKMYNDEKRLFQENSKATLYGSSDAVTALAYDDDTELLHVGTSAGRSVFQGLNRVDNTTDAVGAAISASNGLVAED